MIAVGAILTVAVLGFAQPAPRDGVPPCPTEDSWYCHWNAAYQGNHHGYSFISVGDDVVIYTGRSK
jgi:hypothetical protein